MEHQPYIPGMSPADPGPLSRFIPPLEEGVISVWLPPHASAGSWLLDPFGFSPRLVLEAARQGQDEARVKRDFLLDLAAELVGHDRLAVDEIGRAHV